MQSTAIYSLSQVQNRIISCFLLASILKQHCCISAQMYKHRPVGAVAESPSLPLSACVDFEEDGEAVLMRQRHHIIQTKTLKHQVSLKYTFSRNGLDGESLFMPYTPHHGDWVCPPIFLMLHQSNQTYADTSAIYSLCQVQNRIISCLLLASKSTKQHCCINAHIVSIQCTCINTNLLVLLQPANADVLPEKDTSYLYMHGCMFH